MTVLRRELGEDQQLALAIAEQGKSLAILGEAGSGKSEVSKLLVDEDTMVFAPTGPSALNVGGETCHRGFGIPLGLLTELDRKPIKPRIREKFQKVKRIIIDEALFLRRDILEYIDYVLREVRDHRKPFGGVQMILVGDGFQLPPVVSWNESKAYYSIYDSEWSFTSPVWDFDTVVLRKVWRNGDERQVKMLNSIRKGDKWRAVALDKIYKEGEKYTGDPSIPTLCCYKKDADKINQKWYSRNSNREQIFFSNSKGEEKDLKNMPVPHELKLKVGIRVLICANAEDGSYVNGDAGEILSLIDGMVQVSLDRGGVVWVSPFSWDVFNYTGAGKVVVAQREQIPILLGYAITIHKAQGATLDRVALDLGNGAFAKHQLYVALSRVRDLRNLSFVRPPRESDISVDEVVRAFYDELEINQEKVLNEQRERVG